MKGYGLLPTPKDDRDFPFEKVFGSVSGGALPGSFLVNSRIVIKNQGATDMCTCYAITAVSEDEEGVTLDPWAQFGMVKAISGDIDAYGADLRTACKSVVTPGSLPIAVRDFQITHVATEEDRYNAARSRLAPLEKYLAKKYAKRSFFAVGGKQDTFDNMRSAMWLNRKENRSIFTGIDWNPAWTDQPKGEVTADIGRGDQTYGHAIKIVGWDLGDWMLAQLSNGTDIGEGGIFKLHRDTINEFCTYGAYTFMDMPKEDAQLALRRTGWFSYWLKSILA